MLTEKLPQSFLIPKKKEEKEREIAIISSMREETTREPGPADRSIDRSIAYHQAATIARTKGSKKAKVHNPTSTRISHSLRFPE